LYQLCEDVFSREIHRVPVINDKNFLLDIISASDVVSFIAQHIDRIGSVAEATVGELNLGTRNVISMSSSALAIHAFYLMYYHKVSAVAIVDHDDHLVANLSASDIKLIQPRELDMLLQPIMKFKLGKGHPVSLLLN